MAGPQKVQELTTLVPRTLESPKYKLSKQATGIYSLKNQIATKRKNKVTQGHGHVGLLKAQLYSKNRIKFHLYSVSNHLFRGPFPYGQGSTNIQGESVRSQNNKHTMQENKIEMK